MQSLFDEMSVGLAGVLADVTTVAVGSVSIMLIVFGINTLVSFLMSKDDKEQSEEESIV